MARNDAAANVVGKKTSEQAGRGVEHSGGAAVRKHSPLFFCLGCKLEKFETYSEWEARTFCDNASRRGHGISLKPQCLDGKREFKVTILYDARHPGSESDTFILCRECRDNLKKDARIGPTGNKHCKITSVPYFSLKSHLKSKP